MIEKTVVLRCDPARAFALFTDQAGQWWPSDRRHTEDDDSIIRIEPAGRFYERASDGTEVDLGVVRAFEPARRLVIDWFPGTGRATPTTVEILFEPVDGGTRVTVLHDAGAAGSDLFSQNAPRYERSWDSVLEALASKA